MVPKAGRSRSPKRDNDKGIAVPRASRAYTHGWSAADHRGYRPPVTVVLLATDADWIHDEVDAAVAGPDLTVHRLREGRHVLESVRLLDPDLVVLDLQIGHMGGMAACMEIRLDESVGRLEHVPVLMLLDRRADTFLAERCQADGWLVKPLDAFRLRRSIEALLGGGTWFEGLPSAEEDTGEAVPAGDYSGI
jgi:DNA-binding response OmpR family regulator